MIELQRKMTENLKFIVQEVNKVLKTDYNLISFDSMSVESILQVLVDVFVQFEVQSKVLFKIDTNRYNLLIFFKNFQI